MKKGKIRISLIIILAASLRKRLIFIWISILTTDEIENWMEGLIFIQILVDYSLRRMVEKKGFLREKERTVSIIFHSFVFSICF